MAFQVNMTSMFEKFPKISFFAKTRGWHFILAWCHRVTGILLVIFVWIHIYSYSSPYTLGVQDVKAQGFASLICSLFQWALAIPIIFHAFNGGRLVLYEFYGNRGEETMLRWMTGLAISKCLAFSLLARDACGGIDSLLWRWSEDLAAWAFYLMEASKDHRRLPFGHDTRLHFIHAS
jgi:succinate dehydrogenase / fumarate reductase cytochrome b subunit